MIHAMGRLVTGVREAEERLAAIARALQSVYEEELREATQARDAASRNLARAQAMEEASRALGHEDVTSRVVEVIQQLRASYDAAVARLKELAGIEKTIQLRLTESEHTPAQTALPLPTPSATPSPPVPPAEKPVTEEPPASPGPGDTLVSVPVRVAAAKPMDETLAANAKQLLGRVEEVERLVPRWPRDLAEVTIREHVALVRGLLQKYAAGGWQSPELTGALDRLRTLSDQLSLVKVIGLDLATTADWSRIASEARARRLALMEARKKSAQNATKPG